MFLKLLTLIVFIAAIAVVLLGYRQQRLETINEMTRLHGKMDQSRLAMWELQVKIADHVDPPALAKAIERAQLKLEPTTPIPTEEDDAGSADGGGHHATPGHGGTPAGPNANNPPPPRHRSQVLNAARPNTPPVDEPQAQDAE